MEWISLSELFLNEKKKWKKEIFPFSILCMGCPGLEPGTSRME